MRVRQDNVFLYFIGMAAISKLMSLFFLTKLLDYAENTDLGSMATNALQPWIVRKSDKELLTHTR